jgi:hypothetical protein
VRFIPAVAFSLILTWLGIVPGHAEKRVALVVGNSSYRNVAMLPNPERDAASIAKLFKEAGFDSVIEANNVGNLEFKRAIRRFEDASADADIAVVFYAGHGIEINGTNYLIPVDALLARDRDAQDEAISLDRLIESVEGAKRLRLIILDACRDNPFSKRIKRMIAVRSIAPGLGKIEPTGSDTLIAYAAKAGSTAEDGDGTHSPFTTALLANLVTPGLDVRLAFGRVRDQVMKMTRNRQEPFVYGSLGGKTVALVTMPQRVELAAPPIDNTVRDYEFAREIGTKRAWQSFLAAHGNSYYSSLARAAIDKLTDADERAKGEAQRSSSDQAKMQAAAKRKADEEARAQAEAARKAEAEAEARRRAEADARLKAEAKRKADDQARNEAEAKRMAEQVRLQAEQEANAKLAVEQTKPAPTVIAMAPANETATKSAPPAIDSADLASLLQVHLKRVGCDPGALNGNWTDKSTHAMAQFNAHAHTKFDVKVASLGALEAVRAHKDRVCPLDCGKGQKAEGDRCVAEACKRGYVHNKEGECVREAKTATAPAATNKSSEENILCDRGGCRKIQKNCRLQYHDSPGHEQMDCN